jgi:hypothetical protein
MRYWNMNNYTAREYLISYDKNNRYYYITVVDRIDMTDG